MKLTNAWVLGFASAALARPHKQVPKQPTNGTTGKTYFIVGQNSREEWNGFANAIETPSGISIYCNVYDGTFSVDNQALLSSYAESNSGFVEIGLSWKDDMISHGYTQFEGGRLYNDITNGKYDASLETLGQYLAQYPNVKYVLRPGYEVCPEDANTNPSQNDESTWDLEAYPRTFTHVRERLRASVPNIQFMYHPVRGSAKLLYPGDDVVDIQGFSVFSNDVCLTGGGTTDCPGDTVDPNLLKDIRFATKPKWIAESSAQVPTVNSPDMMIKYLTRVKHIVEKYDFAGWTYINSDWPTWGWNTAYWGDSRIETKRPVKSWFEQKICGNQRYIFG